MPIYKVIAPGFANDKLYDPNGKRNTFSTDKPFNKKNPMPSWLSEMPKETAKQQAAREAAEAAEAEAAAAKKASDEKDIKAVTFLGEGESDQGSNIVETI
jgi:hypothetical protein